MYNTRRPNPSQYFINTSVEGETPEHKIDRLINNKEPLTEADGAPQIFTERAQGVIPECDPRTDRFELAIEGMDRIHKETYAKRAEAQKGQQNKPEPTTNPEPQNKPTPTPEPKK